MKNIANETLVYMWRSKKNRLFMVVLLVVMLIYPIFFVPSFNKQYDSDTSKLEKELVAHVNQIEHAKKEGLIEPSLISGTTAYHNRQIAYGRQRELLTTLRQGDIQRYLTRTSVSSLPRPEETGIKGLYYSLFGTDSLRFKEGRYFTEVEDLNFHVIHEMTSLQQIHLFFLGAGPLLLIIGLAFMISDVHTKDRSIATQKIGLPLNWQKTLFSQSIAALGFVLLFFLFFFMLFYFVNGLLHGFGSFSYPISTKWSTIGVFLLEAIPYALLLTYIFTRLNTLFSLLTKNSIVSMVLLMFVGFAPTIYLDSNALISLDVPFEWLPTEYIHFGKIISGYHSLRPIESGLTVYQSGLLVLTLTLLIIEIVLFVTSKKITRQKFMRKG